MDRAVYYNEFNPYAADWLENLFDFGILPRGVVDRRSIVDVRPQDLKGFTQLHFFAGIGGWPYALSLIRWPDTKPIWTASLPCQPYSGAGLLGGMGDERHLWPPFYRLVTVCRPSIIVGEQVASKDGRYWLAGVRCDLENMGYAVGAADLCAAGIAAPHIRQRLFWLAHADGSRSQGRDAGRADPAERREGSAAERGRQGGGLVHTSSDGRDQGRNRPDRGHDGSLLAADGARREDGIHAHRSGFWDSGEWRVDSKGIARRLEPGLEPLAHGVSGRVAIRRAGGPTGWREHWYNRRGAIEGLGNAIVPQLGGLFVEETMAALADAGLI